jgi:hypothetical protein
MSIDRQYFTSGVSAFFEMATTDAERILPPHLQPIEVRPQRSILNVTAFHFRESEIGPYAELTFSVVVPPVVGSWIRHAKGGFYPFIAATSSEASRRHRSERFCIPHYEKDIEAHFIEKSDELRVKVWGENKPIVDMTVTQHLWKSTTHLLHGFMMDGQQRMKADIQITSDYTVHEHERGRMLLHDHPMTRGLTLEEVSPCPFREHWFKEGTEVFHPLEIL